MNKHLKNIGIATVIAGVLFYPAMKLYQYMARKRDEDGEKEPGEAHKTKSFLHHSKHMPHHKVANNGHIKTAL